MQRPVRKFSEKQLDLWACVEGFRKGDMDQRLCSLLKTSPGKTRQFYVEVHVVFSLLYLNVTTSRNVATFSHLFSFWHTPSHTLKSPFALLATSQSASAHASSAGLTPEASTNHEKNGFVCDPRHLSPQPVVAKRFSNLPLVRNFPKSWKTNLGVQVSHDSKPALFEEQ